MSDAETRSAADAGWFEEVVVELLPELLGVARRMADDQAEAEDVVAETVARGWEHRDDLEDRDKLRAWLFSILRNCQAARRRKEDARPDEVPLPGEGEDEPSFSIFERLHQPFLLWWGNPEEEFFESLLQEDLERAVDELPEIHRCVVVLADVQGLSYAEIAEVLEIPVGTVRSRLSRARSKLQEALWSHAVDAGLREPVDEDSPSRSEREAKAE